MYFRQKKNDCDNINGKTTVPFSDSDFDDSSCFDVFALQKKEK